MRRLSHMLLSGITVTLYYLCMVSMGYPKMDPYIFAILVALVYIINKDEMTDYEK